MASLGPDLEVSEARKVRSKGVLGFFAKEHYEVLAEPKLSDDTLARAEASLDDTLQSLMARIEAEETPAAFAASLAAAATIAPPPPSPAVLVAAPACRPGEPRWSRDALQSLGIHPRVLGRLAAAEGSPDEEWTMDLAGALRVELAAAAASVPDGLVTVSGTGAAAAVAMIRAAACGFPVDLLRLPGGDVPATALELALAVRSCLPR